MLKKTVGYRREIKLLSDAADIDFIKSHIKINPVSFYKEYPDRLVNNIYFDTEELDNYYNNLHGMPDRQKVRLRWYGQLNSLILNPSLEVKIKRGIMQRKEVCPLRLEFSLTSSWVEIIKTLQELGLSKDFAIMSLYDKPSLINQYRREYYRSFDQRYRLTLDYDLKYYSQLYSQYPNLKNETDMKSVKIIEVKIHERDCESVQMVTNSLPFEITKSSKYIMGIQSSV